MRSKIKIKQKKIAENLNPYVKCSVSNKVAIVKFRCPICFESLAEAARVLLTRLGKREGRWMKRQLTAWDFSCGSLLIPTASLDLKGNGHASCHVPEIVSMKLFRTFAVLILRFCRFKCRQEFCFMLSVN